MKSYIYFFLIVLTTFCVGSCKKTKQESPQLRPFAETITNEDSVAITRLVDQYFNYQIKGDYYEAAAMLYRPNAENKDFMPEPLEQEALESIVKSMQYVPVLEYSIEYLKFGQTYDNEVMVKITMIKGQNGLPDVTSKVIFKPISYLGNWFLSVLDSSSGDKQLLTSDERKAIMLDKQQ